MAELYADRAAVRIVSEVAYRGRLIQLCTHMIGQFIKGHTLDNLSLKSDDEMRRSIAGISRYCLIFQRLKIVSILSRRCSGIPGPVDNEAVYARQLISWTRERVHGKQIPHNVHSNEHTEIQAVRT